MNYFYNLLQEKGKATLVFKLEKAKGKLENCTNTNFELKYSSDSTYNIYKLEDVPIMLSHYVPSSIPTTNYPYAINITEDWFFDCWKLNGEKSEDGKFVNKNGSSYVAGRTYEFIASFYKGIKITLDANGGKFALSESLTCIKINGNPVYNEQGLINNNCAEKGYLWSDNKIILCFKSITSTNVEILRAASVTENKSSLTHSNGTYKLAGWSSVRDDNTTRESKWTFTNSSNSTYLYATWGVETLFAYKNGDSWYASRLYKRSYASHEKVSGGCYSDNSTDTNFAIIMVSESEPLDTTRSATYKVYYDLKMLSKTYGLVLKFLEFGLYSEGFGTLFDYFTSKPGTIKKLKLTLTNNDANISIYNSGTSPIYGELNVEDCKKVTFKIEITASNTYTQFWRKKKTDSGMGGPNSKFRYLKVVKGIPDEV